MTSKTTGEPVSVAVTQGQKVGTAFTPSAIDSRLPDEAWLELRYLHVSSPTDAFLSLFIQAYARIPSEQSLHGSIVQVITAVGLWCARALRLSCPCSLHCRVCGGCAACASVFAAPAAPCPFCLLPPSFVVTSRPTRGLHHTVHACMFFLFLPSALHTRSSPPLPPSPAHSSLPSHCVARLCARARCGAGRITFDGDIMTFESKKELWNLFEEAGFEISHMGSPSSGRRLVGAYELVRNRMLARSHTRTLVCQKLAAEFSRALAHLLLALRAPRLAAAPPPR